MSNGQASTPPPAVHAEGVVKRFGPTVALDQVGITVAVGDSHALVGRNGAGKSTLVSVLTGLHAPDAGRVAFNGEPAPAPGDTAAWQARVACVYQKSMVVPELTVAENLFLNRFERGRIRWSRLRADARDLLAEYGVDVDPATRAADLTVEQGQFVEIARALSFGARFIILDEPTAQLDAAGIERLFTKLRELQQQGVAFLFISHHLQEVYDLCSTVTVYRDARHILTAPVAELGKADLVAAMTGEAAQAATTWHAKSSPAQQPAEPAAGDTVLRAEGLALDGVFQPIDFAVRAGEVLGLAGATASGNTALGETLVGLRKATGGSASVDGRGVRPGSVPHALNAGIGYVPEDRHRQGLVLGRSVAENATLTVTDQLGPYGTVLPSRTRTFAQRMIDSLDIKTSGPAQPVSDLSGGNQQKVVIARALARDPRVLVAIRPTAGVDVKSKDALLGVVRGVADRGDAAVIVSDELDDLRVCDRVIALFHGRVIAEFGSGWTDRDLVSAMEGLPAGAGGDKGAEE
ncbi:sugar ABC transporter ATP-binding protein [Actinacidiphila bryophytorum]|uniref:Simple sugar transport system ATP-binding protein n=1 Tax=Actinacidiphila bryophytorum TaxID=1436133 RepID=A0A9W4H7Z3_9ACTN|nr:sugar ABC transporter ATP-binding protein [Actinacidiphila bryophytorum]MBM9437793.1 sugar ABC transporter ATP-binding protein [Actinacidiphila bryophytorum]MBN6545603.1 sugar ABC transporter ATP-binding protein [Actinacidiphila bryophytorum]CAG7656974.1 Simple sugar transport system ATP-binding protein [Actinacidiphila bryophytorum]